MSAGDGTREIALRSGHVALIDSVDWPLVAGYCWYASDDGRGHIYVIASARSGVRGGPRVRLHRVIVGAAPGTLVDHWNHDGLDNRRSNLRVCTNEQNGANSRRSRLNRSGYKGVTWHKARGKWRAAIAVGGGQRHLGLFEDAWEAAQAYNAAALKAWGPFALLNEPLAECGTPDPLSKRFRGETP